MTAPTGMEQRRLSLEEAFFQEQERRIMERQRQQHRLEETKRGLAAASGIRNDAVLQRLVELDVRPETLASLALAPVVCVAWCDGEVSAREREAILACAQRGRDGSQRLDCELLEQWLTHRPPPSLLEAWRQYVHGLGEQLSPEERRALRDEVVGHARQVAAASGGVLGLCKVSAVESRMLADIEAAFNA